MSRANVEGTFRLDGLLEGPLFTEDDESYLKQFTEQARQDNIHFALSLQSNRFSLLADPHIQLRPTHCASIDTFVSKHLNRLLQNYTPQEYQKLMSTVRSSDFTPGKETQTIYAIDSNGKICIEQRTIACETIPPAAPLTKRQKYIYGLSGIGIVILLLAISIFFVPYRKMGVAIVENLKPYNIERLETTSVYEDFFSIENISRNTKLSCFIIICKKTDNFPSTKEELNAAWIQASQSMSNRLAIESLARQQIRCILYNEAGKIIRRLTLPIHLPEDDTEHLIFQIPFDRSVKRINLTF